MRGKPPISQVQLNEELRTALFNSFKEVPEDKLRGALTQYVSKCTPDQCSFLANILLVFVVLPKLKAVHDAYEHIHKKRRST